MIWGVKTESIAKPYPINQIERKAIAKVRKALEQEGLNYLSLKP